MELGENLSNLRSKTSSFFKALIAALLLGFTQMLPTAGFLGPMVVPLFFVVLGFPSGWFKFTYIFFQYSFQLFGGIIFYIGVVVFCVALLQWFWFRHRKRGLFSRGLYARTRHPQFLGIIVATLGLTIAELTTFDRWGLVGFGTRSIGVGIVEFVGLWFLQVLGYIAFAVYEERGLSKKFVEFNNYRENVPLLFPIKSPKRIPEVVFTILLVICICILLLLLPYDTIRTISFH